MSSIVIGHNHPRRRSARFRTGGLVAGILVLLLSSAYLIFLRWTRIAPPEEAEEAEARAPRPPVQVHGPRASVGPNWVSRERGVWEYHLEGEPFDMGYAHARLGSRLLMETEDYMFSEMNRYVPSRLSLFVLRALVLAKYRHIGADLRPEHSLEIAGMSRGFFEQRADFLPSYHRLVFYHALHDITQGVEHSPLLGCTAFAAAGPATQSGHLIIGRNFDFEGPPIFDKDKAVLFFRPKGKIPFASVGWTGLSGVVTALNAEGIYVSVNAARTDDKGDRGVPVELLLREVMESAHSINEAVALLQTRPVMIPDFYLLGDGKTGEAVVVERTPKRLYLRRSKDMIGLANHALAPELQGDKANERLKTYLTSGARYQRMMELLQQNRGIIDPRKALEMLRDKRGVGGEPLALGNRNALDALIATHSVVVDATSMVLWVGAGPHALGRYVAFDLRRELLGDERQAPADLPEDPVLHSSEYQAYLTAQTTLKAAELLQQKGEHTRAIEEAERAVALQPQLPEARRLLGDLLTRRAQPGDRERARREYQTFLETQPPYLKDVEDVRAILKGL